MKIKRLMLTILLCITQPIYGAVYNLPSHLTNIPIYTHFDKKDIITGISSGFYTIDGSAQYEFDLKTMFAFSNRLLIGGNMVNKADFVIHMHYQFYSTIESKLKVSGGITDIALSGKSEISSFDNYSVTQKNALSPYITASYLTEIARYHVGFGGGRFQYSDRDSSHLKNFDGLFFGVEIPVSTAFINIEYDGKDFNIGASIPMTHRTTFYGSLTEFYRFENDGSNNINPQYNNQPLRWFSFGINHRFNFSKPDEEKEIDIQRFSLKEKHVKKIVTELNKTYNDEINKWRDERGDLIEEINRLKQAVKEDIRYIDKEEFESKEAFRQRYLSTNQETSEKVLSYYYESFEYYAQKQYYEAIQVLQKAIALNPYLPQLYVRMGSIYFDLNLTKMALLQWEKALELDPQNLKLQERVSALKKL
ncbi:hypothetical protein DID74_00970 [Candidatus Marinamargulisbacteria bacterium SCGC AG-333-B06]|nr:hypothetical protein DID74_00970 [Candidatus Marinamargulisbacteria bacterium SCGC AG-333-B06]